MPLPTVQNDSGVNTRKQENQLTELAPSGFFQAALPVSENVRIYTWSAQELQAMSDDKLLHSPQHPRRFFMYAHTIRNQPRRGLILGFLRRTQCFAAGFDNLFMSFS